jgi:cyclophilin family peptidyl-prolyl cis-trans isomerase
MRSGWSAGLIPMVFSLTGICLCAGPVHVDAKIQAVSIALIDTTMGRLRCTLYDKEAPTAVGAFIGFAEGSRPWWNSAADAMAKGKPLYDGMRLYGIPAGLRGGSRTELRSSSGAPSFFVPESEKALRFDRPGRLALRGREGLFGGEFIVLDHANSEDDGKDAVVIGECDEASLPVITALSHDLMTADNRPEKPIAINRVVIVRDGAPEPKVASNVPESVIVPKLQPLPVPAVAAPEPLGPLAIIETSLGPLSCQMFTKESPIGTAAFMGLADGSKEWTNPQTKQVEHGKRFYDGMIFDRVIPDFVIQSGDLTGDISGGTDIGFRFKNESTPGLSFDRPGRLAFGNNGPDTNNSEIFISEHPMRRLDGGFTIIGQCDDASVRLVEKIARVPRDANNRPIEPVRIVRISFFAR